jgi:hypothetical protein
MKDQSKVCRKDNLDGMMEFLCFYFSKSVVYLTHRVTYSVISPKAGIQGHCFFEKKIAVFEAANVHGFPLSRE